MSSYVRSFFDDTTGGWLITMLDEDEHPWPFSGDFMGRETDGSLVIRRPIGLPDFDENGWFRLPEGAVRA